MKFIQYILASIAFYCLFAVSIEARRSTGNQAQKAKNQGTVLTSLQGKNCKIKKNSLRSYFIDYSEFDPARYPAPSGPPAFPVLQDGVPGGYLENFVYTRIVYDSVDPSTRKAIGSATYNTVLDYKNSTAENLEICFAGTYTSIVQFNNNNTASNFCQTEVAVSGTVAYRCRTPPNTDSFTTIAIDQARVPFGKSPVTQASSVVNNYSDKKGLKTQKWTNVGIYDRQGLNTTTFSDNCNFNRAPGTVSCTTEYILDFKKGRLTQGPPKGFVPESPFP